MSDAQLLQSPQDLALQFRSILACFAKPAVPASIATTTNAPLPLLPSTACLVLTLFDYQTPVWLSAALNTDAVRKFIRFHTGAAITANVGEASFAIMTMDEANVDWPDFNLGTHEYPDRSTSVIVQVQSFTGYPAVEVSGPGLKDPVSFQLEAANADFWKRMQDNACLFPIGVDFVFSSPQQLAVLPRSSRIRFGESD
jgi:alpha-D-ribose 1-methylphosphonate 5-triphosphate synthase subunit PhnH